MLPRPIELLVNGQSKPLGVDTPNPTLGWKLVTEPGAHKIVWTHYAVEVSRSTSFQKSSLEWDTGKTCVEEGQLAVNYGGKPLQSKTRYYWRARIWCQDRREPAQHPEEGDGVVEADTWESVKMSWFETGLLGQKDGTAVSDSTSASMKQHLPWPQIPLYRRICYRIGVLGFMNLLFRPLLALRHLRSTINPPRSAPSLVKTYGCRRNLPVRIFFPRNHSPDSPNRLPLLLTVHGGGFTFGDPTDNDDWNSTFANRHSTLVVALNYSKAPSHPFPAAHSDLEALIRAVLADKALERAIDPAKVALLGWSAGGNLALGVSTLPTVREKIAAVVALYPATDFSATTAQKTATRRYKPSLPGPRGWARDVLGDPVSAVFGWAYVPPGTDTRDPLLSPAYADRADLPRRVWLLGCELDLLAHDAWRMASRLAGRPVPSMGDKVGREEVAAPRGELVLEGDERFAWVEEVAGGEYRWLLVPDVLHGFDMPVPEIRRDREEREDAEAKTEKLTELIAEWLWR